MNKKKSTNNGLAVLPANIQAIRDQVMVDELKARHWRAQYETAYYHMEFDKLLPAYTEFLQKLQEQREEVEKQQKEHMEEIMKMASEGVEKGFNVEEIINTPGVYGDGSQGGA